MIILVSPPLREFRSERAGAGQRCDRTELNRGGRL